jgi:uncharacterized protein related to proFAR isomerase
MEGFRRLLVCMEYPFSSTVDLSSSSDCVNLVTWLEDRKIRKMEVNEREALRQHGTNWNVTFSNYLSSLDCPFLLSESSLDCFIWLINYAVAAEYEDCADSLTEVIESEKHSSEEDTSDFMVVDDVAPIESISTSGVDSIGSLLGLQRQKSETNPGLLQNYWFSSLFVSSLYFKVFLI